MTNNERKLRRQHQDDRDIIASLNRIADQRRVRIDELLSALELAKSEAAIRRDMYVQLCQLQWLQWPESPSPRPTGRRGWRPLPRGSTGGQEALGLGSKPWTLPCSGPRRK
jgi:hypothetical protein